MGDNLKSANGRPPTAEFGVATCGLGSGRFFVSVYGDVDLLTAPELETELSDTAQRADASHVVVDLTETTFFDSSGVHAVVRAGERLHSRGLQLAIVCGSSVINSVLRITGVDQTFPVHETIESALAPSRALEAIAGPAWDGGV